MSCYKKIIVLSKANGQTPTFIAEKGVLWEYFVSFGGAFDGVWLIFGNNAKRVDKSGATDEDLSLITGVAITYGEEIVSYGFTDKTLTKSRLNEILFPPYDDEAIATENYYEDVYEQENENAFFETQRKKSGDDESAASGARKNDYGIRFDAQSQTFAASDGKNGAAGVFEAEGDYYDKVRCRISRLFSANEPYLPLKNVIPFSRWVIVEGEKRYFLGLVGKPDYICYATEGDANTPPENLKGAFFVPKSYFGESTHGYFVVIQSAATGEQLMPKF